VRHRLQSTLRVERPPQLDILPQREQAVSSEVRAGNLNIGITVCDRVGVSKRLPHFAETTRVVNMIHQQLVIPFLVGNGEQAKLAHELRAQELQDERIIAIVSPCILENASPITATGDDGQILFILSGGIFADPPDIHHHLETELVRIDAAVESMVPRYLQNDVRVIMQDLEVRSVSEQSLFPEHLRDVVVRERRAPFIHHLRLPLRVEILSDDAHYPQDLTLPRLERGRILFEEVEQILFGKIRSDYLALSIILLLIVCD